MITQFILYDSPENLTLTLFTDSGGTIKKVFYRNLPSQYAGLGKVSTSPSRWTSPALDTRAAACYRARARQKMRTT